MKANKSIKRMICVLGITFFLIPTTVFAINKVFGTEVTRVKKDSLSSESNEIKTSDTNVSGVNSFDEILIKSFMKTYDVSREEILKLKADLGDWNEVSKALYAKKHDKSLSEDKITELYNEGYNLQDISQAQNVAMLCDKTAEEILVMKGKPAQASGSGDKYSNSSKTKSWDEIEKVLNVDNRSAEEQLGITKEKKEELQKEGLTEKQIIDAAVLAKNYSKDKDEVFNKIKDGSTLEEIKKGYFEEKLKIKGAEPTKEEVFKNIEDAIKKQYNITDAEINKYKESGFNAIDISIAESLAKKYNKKVEDILSMKKNIKEWKDVYSLLGGGK